MMESTPYASGVGGIMYEMIYSRPDLAYAVSIELVYGKPGYCALANFEVDVEVFE